MPAGGSDARQSRDAAAKHRAFWENVMQEQDTILVDPSLPSTLTVLAKMIGRCDGPAFAGAAAPQLPACPPRAPPPQETKDQWKSGGVL